MQGFDELSWDDVRLVGLVAEAGTLPAAALRLGAHHSTVFRRLRQIEAAFGGPLFERRGGALAPTGSGEEIAALAARLGAEVSATSARLMGREAEPEGELRVDTNDSLLLHLLTPILAEFARACPRVRLDVVVGNPALDLSRRDADVAIRATDHPPETLVGRRVARIAWALYGGRGHDIGEAPRYVALGEEMAGMAVVRHAAEVAGAVGVPYRVNTVPGLAEAIEAGIGIGHLPCFIGDGRPGLSRLAEPEARFATDLWLLTHADLRGAARVRAFLQVVANGIARRRALIEGEAPQPGQDTAPAGQSLARST